MVDVENVLFIFLIKLALLLLLYSLSEETVLDDGTALREVILIQEKYLGENFPATLLILGGMGLAIHYEQLASLYDGVPLIMAFGSPVSGKSLAVEMAMSLLSIRESIGGTDSAFLKLNLCIVVKRRQIKGIKPPVLVFCNPS